MLDDLLDYIRDRKLASPEPWVEGSLFARIVDVAGRVGTARPISILRELGGAATYEDVRISIACLNNRT